jgi:hypothetical protein
MTSEIKWIIGAVIALILIFGGYKLYHLGYDEAMATIDHDNRIATDAAVASAQKELESAQKLIQTGIQNVQSTKEKIVYVTQKAQAIVAPKCPDVGPDFAGVYNQYINTIQSNADTSRHQFDAKMSTPSANANAGINPTQPATPIGGRTN